MQSKFRNSIIVTALGIFIWQFCSPVTAETVAEFYQGRSITIHMGFPGGGFFASAQLAGKHMQKHIPGNPKLYLSLDQGGSARLCLIFWHIGHPRTAPI